LVMDAPRLKSEVRHGFMTAGVVIVALALLLAAMTIAAANVFVVGPLRRLSHAMARARGGDFMTRAPVETHDEVGSLAETFNTMLARITDLKAQEIDRTREVELLHREVAL